jgi:hypothetical protein
VNFGILCNIHKQGNHFKLYIRSQSTINGYFYIFSLPLFLSLFLL